MRIQWLAWLAAIAIAMASACGGRDLVPTNPSNLQIKGAMHHVTVEGGFWAIVGDDGVTYDPMQGIDAKFQHEGLRVWVEARLRTDVGGVHMVGPVIEIVQIKTL